MLERLHPTAEQIEDAAEAMWNSAKPVKVGVRPCWADVVNDPNWAPGVASTRADAAIALSTLPASVLNDPQEPVVLDLEELRASLTFARPGAFASITNAELVMLIDRTEIGESLTKAHPCTTSHEPPYDFKVCTTHDRTFPLDGDCDHAGKSTLDWIDDMESAQRSRAVIAEEIVAEALALHSPMMEGGTPVGCSLCDCEHESGQGWPCKSIVILGGKR